MKLAGDHQDEDLAQGYSVKIQRGPVTQIYSPTKVRTIITV
uniref:Uncharacterized protein n=1 Tax=Anguilla anguilla TaxID=7936 RepID=A0A0E9V7I8_ANGAN